MNIAELLKILVLGIVEGITEWLPISSTGHMILVEEFIKLNVSRDFWEMFLVVIQLGAILAVVVLYFEKLNPWAKKKSPVEKKATFNLWGKTLVGCLPAALIGLPLDDWMEAHFFNATVVAIALIVYGVVFILIERRHSSGHFNIESFDQLSYKTALAIGIFQVLSLIPGTSRSGSTIIGGMLCGTSRFIATEFSFFMSIPVMFGASLLKLVKFGFDFTAVEAFYLIFGMVVAFVVSIMAIKFLLNYLKRNDFKAFGYYRIVLGIVVLTYFYLF
ncbi:undecaprenyl-diphosphate phosphatase [Peptococcus simiae]